jgi:uncharacterized membrane protein (Fun14 family)
MTMFNSNVQLPGLCGHSCRTFNASESNPSYLGRVPLDTSGLATLLLSQVGFGGTLGFLLGYGLKKVAAIVLKIVALISGLFMLGLTWLAWIGVITINFNAFTNVAGNSFANALAALAASLAFLGQIVPLGGSFGLGFYLGAKKG